jgi:hypothetical protein
MVLQTPVLYLRCHIALIDDALSWPWFGPVLNDACRAEPSSCKATQLLQGK